MSESRLQSLLAPTWRERARAADAYMLGPAPTPEEIRVLEPSPELFLAALVSFWAEPAALQMREAMAGMARPPQPGGGWRSAQHENAFPMTPALAELETTGWHGVALWQHFAALGPYVGALEAQLLACLDHPHGSVESGAA